jgi:hypothetical protein
MGAPHPSPGWASLDHLPFGVTLIDDSVTTGNPTAGLHLFGHAAASLHLLGGATRLKTGFVNG